MNSTESIPQVWDDERDGQFFRLTASLFSPAYCCGASVLLASYDDDSALTLTVRSDLLPVARRTAAPAAPIATR